MKPIRWLIILTSLAVTGLISLWAISSWADEATAPGSYLALALAFLFPIGLTLVAWGALPDDQRDRAVVLAPLALAVAMIGYMAVGFGFHFGGAAFISEKAGLQGLSRFFSLVRGPDSPNWGLIGLEGFFLSGDAATPAAMQLFLSQLPLVTGITLIAMLALPRRLSPLIQILTGLLVSAVTYPVTGHWVSGGGWLAHLGQTLNLGHGLVDFAGLGALFLLGGGTALAAALLFGHRRQPVPSDQEVPMPPAHFPLLAGLGVLLAVVGWIGLGLANPLYAELSSSLNWPRIFVNGLAGLAGGALLSQLYSWFSTGRFDPLMGPRGALAGLIAVGAGAPFVPPWAATLTGAVAGLLLPLAVYGVDRLWHLEDTTAAIATYGLSSFWGLLAVALFADGRWGQGWNDVAGLPGQGVSGLLVASGLQADSGQLGAQVWGGLAVFAVGFFVPWGILKLIAGLSGLRTRLVGGITGAGRRGASREGQRPSGGQDWVVDTKDGQ